jgi:hypothetical protein
VCSLYFAVGKEPVHRLTQIKHQKLFCWQIANTSRCWRS